MSEPEQSRSEGGGRPPGRRGAKPCPKCQQTHWDVIWKNGAFHGRAWDPVKKMPRTRKAGSHALAFKVAAKLATAAWPLLELTDPRPLLALASTLSAMGAHSAHSAHTADHSGPTDAPRPRVKHIKVS